MVDGEQILEVSKPLYDMIIFDLVVLKPTDLPAN